MIDIARKLLELGLPNLLVSFSTPFFSFMLGYYFMKKLLPNRLNFFVLGILSFIYALWYHLRAPDLLGTRYNLFMTIFVNAMTYFILVFLFKGKLWRKVLVWWYFDVFKTMCEAIAYVPILLYLSSGGTRESWVEVVAAVNAGAALKLVYTLLLLSTFYMLGVFSLKVWRKVLLERFELFYLLFLALPLGLRFALSNVIHPNMGNPFFSIFIYFMPDKTRVYQLFSLTGILVCLLADAAILFYAISLYKKSEIDAQIQETARIMEREQARYREIEQRSDALAKIRHDFNNQLSTIAQLARLGDDGAALGLIDALAKEIQDTDAG